MQIRARNPNKYGYQNWARLLNPQRKPDRFKDDTIFKLQLQGIRLLQGIIGGLRLMSVANWLGLNFGRAMASGQHHGSRYMCFGGTELAPEHLGM